MILKFCKIYLFRLNDKFTILFSFEVIHIDIDASIVPVAIPPRILVHS